MAAFQFFDNYWDSFRQLSNEELGQIVRAMCVCAFEDGEPELTGTPSVIFALVRPFVEKSAERSKSGQKGGRKGKPGTASKANQEQLSKLITDSFETKRNETKRIETNKPTKRAEKFTPPSVGEVLEFLKSEQIVSFTAQEFVDFYTSNGWRVGRNPMKDWRATARNWNNRRKGAGNGYRRADEPSSYEIEAFEG